MSVIIDSDNNNVNITEEPINVTVSLGGPDVAAVWGGITGDLADQEDLQAVLDDKVPYTGATGDVNLGEYGIQLGNLEFDNTPTNVPTPAGSVYWSDTDGTLNMVLKGGQTISRIGETQHIRALNNTGAQIARGKVVYVVGAQGQRLTIALADADTEILSKDTIGFTSEAIADGAEGFVIVQGVINNVSTTGMTDGATVYLSQTAGGYTTTPPVDPAHLVILGFIVNGGSGGAGSIYVKVDNGYELGELHDVNTTGATNGQVLTYNGTTWVADDPAAGGITSIATSAPITGGTITTSGTIGITQAGAAADGYLSATDWNTFNNKQAALTNPVTGTGTAGQVSYWSGTGTQTGSNNLFWDNANQRLDIIGKDALNATNSFIIKDNANRNLFYVKNDGEVGNAVTGATQLQWRFGTSATNPVLALIRQSTTTVLSSGNSGNAFVGTESNQPFGILSNNTLRIFIEAAGNVAIGLTSSISARLHVRGSGTTSATTALLVQNSTPSELFKVQDNGAWNFNGDGVIKGSGNTSSTTALTVQNSDSTNLLRIRNDARITLADNVSISSFSSTGIIGFVGEANREINFGISQDNTSTAGIKTFILITRGFSPTSGTAIHNALTYSGTINQTGGANGITRGLYVNPTLTSAADWRSVEFSNNTGWGLYGAGTANNYLGGKLGIGTTSLTYQNFAINRTITGATISTSYEILGNVQSDVTNIASGYSSAIGTQNAVFTLNSLRHVFIQQGTFGASSTVSSQSAFHVNSSLTGATNNYGFYGGINSGLGRWNLYMEGTANNYLAGNTSIGTTTSGGRVTIQGSGTTFATTALQVRNSSGSIITSILDDGRIVFGTGTTSIRPDANTLRLNSNTGGSAGGEDFSFGSGQGNIGTTSGTFHVINIRSGASQSFNPTSGTGVFNVINIPTTINQTGGANGITRGLYVNPTLTAAADWRGLESVATSNANHTLLKLRNATVDVFTVKADSKIGFFNATPVAQPTTGIAEAAFVENSGGTAVNVDSTFAGYTIQQIAQALKDYGLLA